jgi:hypothetical protein
MTQGKVSREDGDQGPTRHLAKSGGAFFFPVGLPLEIEVGGVSIRMSSVAVGYLADICLIIRYPSTGSLGSIESRLFKGNNIIVRYVSRGNAFGFQSELLGMTREPVRLLFISYPTVIARHSLRSDRRVECHLPAKLRIDSTVKDSGFVGIITDLSTKGCGFTMAKVSRDTMSLGVRMEDPVIIDFQLPGIESRIKLLGSIRNLKRDSKKISVGIQFPDIAKENKARIFEFISTVEEFIWEG